MAALQELLWKVAECMKETEDLSETGNNSSC